VGQVTTKFTGFENKSGTNDNGAWKLTKFQAEDGKKYQTFDDDIREQGKAFEESGEEVTVVFEVQKRGQNTNNVIESLEAASSGGSSAASSGGSSGGEGAGIFYSPIAYRIEAFGVAIKFGEFMVQSGQLDELDFSGVVRISDMIVAYGEGKLAGGDPDDATPPGADAEAVPD